MESEIEKLYTEAVPNRRSKMSIKNLDLTFRKIGIVMSIQQIRNLFFRYDKSKSKELDLEEFRQLIEDIIENPEQSLTLPNLSCCNDLHQGMGVEPNCETNIQQTDVIGVDGKPAPSGLLDGGNGWKVVSLWSSDDVQVVSGSAELWEGNKTSEDKMFAAKVKQLNEKYETEKDINQQKLQEEHYGKENQQKRRPKTGKFTRTFSLRGKSDHKKKEREKLHPSGLLTLITSDGNKKLHLDMYGENGKAKKGEEMLRKLTHEGLKKSSEFNRNVLRKSIDSCSNTGSGGGIGERDRILHTYTLPRKSSKKPLISSQASLVQSVSVSRKPDFFYTISNTKVLSAQKNKKIAKETTGVNSNIYAKKENIGQKEWSEQRGCMTLPRKSASRIDGQRSFSFKSDDRNVFDNFDTRSKSFITDLRVKLKT